MKVTAAASVLVTGLIELGATTVIPKAVEVASVDLSTTTGAVKNLASGWIYGFPDNGIEAQTAIPSDLISDVKFIATRAGGAQLPYLGWKGGYTEYQGRFDSTLSNHRTARQYNGEFILLVHDLWGADGSATSIFPGDDGNWTETDAFLTQLSKDIEANDMLPGLVLDIWNEPDLEGFWNRTWDQYLDFYVHAHKLLRTTLPDTLISGPSKANSPRLGDSRWDSWLKTVSQQDAVPDRYSWHQIDITSNRQPDTTVPDFNTLKSTYGLPDRQIDVNEYAWITEQTPAFSAYYIAQLERHNILGLRANWGSGGELHNLLADLLFLDENNVYRPNGEWQLYKYYASMSGQRVQTTASADLTNDVYATVNGSHAQILSGSTNRPDPYEVSISGLEGLGLASSGIVSVRTLRFDWVDKDTEITGPVDLGTIPFNYSGGKVTLNVNPATNTTAYAFELSA